MNFLLFFSTIMCLNLSAHGADFDAEEADFMDTLLTSGKTIIGKILQPAINRYSDTLLKKHLPKEEAAETSNAVELQDEAAETSNAAELQDESLSPDEPTPISSTTPYVGPLRNIRKKNRKQKSGSIGLHAPAERRNVEQDAVHEAWLSHWGDNSWSGNAWSANMMAPFEILFSPYFANKNPWCSQEIVKRFTVKPEYRMAGTAADINVPFVQDSFNVISKLFKNVRDKKFAAGVCTQIDKNTAFAVISPRYAPDGRVRRNSTVINDLEQECYKYPHTFLSSIFVPG